MLPITPFPNGVPEDSQSPTKVLVEALWFEGLTVTEIARRLGVSKPTVCFHMRTLGIRSDSRFSRRYDCFVRASNAIGITPSAGSWRTA